MKKVLKQEQRITKLYQQKELQLVVLKYLLHSSKRLQGVGMYMQHSFVHSVMQSASSQIASQKHAAETNQSQQSLQTLLTVKNVLLENMAKLSPQGSISRMTNACPFTGRVRGFYNFAKMSRMEFKAMASAGRIPGIRKAS